MEASVIASDLLYEIIPYMKNIHIRATEKKFQKYYDLYHRHVINYKFTKIMTNKNKTAHGLRIILQNNGISSFRILDYRRTVDLHAKYRLTNYEFILKEVYFTCHYYGNTYNIYVSVDITNNKITHIYINNYYINNYYINNYQPSANHIIINPNDIPKCGNRQLISYDSSGYISIYDTNYEPYTTQYLIILAYIALGNKSTYPFFANLLKMFK
jgi:hypothetical protein